MDTVSASRTHPPGLYSLKKRNQPKSSKYKGHRNAHTKQVTACSSLWIGQESGKAPSHLLTVKPITDRQVLSGTQK